MSNTRQAREGSPLRQERYCSSVEHERGLLCNLVTRRLEGITDTRERELIFGLQAHSHKLGGIEGLAKLLVEQFPNEVATPGMQRLGFAPGRVYTSEEVRSIREEFDLPSKIFHAYDCGFPLASDAEELRSKQDESGDDACIHDIPDSVRYPTKYPAEKFVQECRQAAHGLPRYLTELCLDPASSLAKGGPWYFPNLIQTLWRYKEAVKNELRSRFVLTEIGSLVWESLDYSLETGGLVLIEGSARTGKTSAAKCWTDLHEGRARYVQVPSTNDDLGFYRAIAKALGVSSTLSLKCQQIRERVEYVLQEGRIMLILDESHNIWPQNNRREALPSRLNWLLSVAVNQGVSAALISTPQFTAAQKIVEKKTGWQSAQFIGRVADYKRLPDRLKKSDLEAIARTLLPEGNNKMIELLVAHAQGSARYLQGIDSVVTRARYVARKAGREKVLGPDLVTAIEKGTLPSDNALAEALSEGKRPPPRPPRRMAQPAPALPASRQLPPTGLQNEPGSSHHVANRGPLDESIHHTNL